MNENVYLAPNNLEERRLFSNNFVLMPFEILVVNDLFSLEFKNTIETYSDGVEFLIRELSIVCPEELDVLQKIDKKVTNLNSIRTQNGFKIIRSDVFRRKSPDLRVGGFDIHPYLDRSKSEKKLKLRVSSDDLFEGQVFSDLSSELVLIYLHTLRV